MKGRDDMDIKKVKEHKIFIDVNMNIEGWLFLILFFIIGMIFGLVI